jgi:hypothetical protein
LARHRYSNDQEVQDWLDMLAIEACQETQPNGNTTGDAEKPGFADPGVPGAESGAELDRQLGRAYQSISPTDRLPYSLHTLLAMPLPKVDRLMGWKAGTAENCLETTRKKMLYELVDQMHGDPSLDDEGIRAWLNRSFRQQWESGRLAANDTPSLLIAIQSLVEEKRNKRRRRVVLQEILLVAFVVVLIYALVQVAVFLSAEPHTGGIPQSAVINLIPALF